MKRCVFLIALACFAQAPKNESAPVRIEIGAHKEVTVTVPNIARDQLAGIAAAFFSRDRPETIPKLRKAFSEASEITLTLTTK